MEVKISDLKLKNFKGIKELQINFDCKNTNIYGKNATGKTTIFDAFKWVFFDKDSNDRKDFNIKTLDSNNKPIHHLEHEVEATLVIDGIDMTFKKILKEKWVKKRGQEQQEFAGHETNYWIDEVPVKKKDYEEKINSLIPESLFKLITDPTFFNNQMKWQERRELLLNISGTNITDKDILDSNVEFEKLKKNLEDRSMEDYKKVVGAKIKDLNNQKESIPSRIDELTKTIITAHEINYEGLEKEKENCNLEIKKLDDMLTNVQAKAQENMKKVDKLSVVKNELNNLKFKLEVEHDNKYSVDTMNLNNSKTAAESHIRNITNEIQERNLKIESDTNKKQILYKEWDKLMETKLEFDPTSFICPTCKREYETSKIDEMKKQFEDNFTQHKESEKQRINKEGQILGNNILENQQKIEELKNSLSAEESKLNEINKSLNEIEENSSKIKPFDVTALPEYQQKIKEVEELSKIVDNLTSEDTSEIHNKKTEIFNRLNEIDKTLNERLVQDKTKARIMELEIEEEKISQKIQELEEQQYQIEQFTKAKVELFEKSINEKFEIVKFRLFDTQINGGLVECCDTLVNGVPYSDVNNAHKILAGLDIINTLIKFYSISAPIFIDNRESINEIYNIDTQIISLIVTEDKELKINVQ